MANISILTGEKGASRLVEGLPFLPGVYVHKTHGSMEGDSYTLTHVESGLAVLLHIIESDLETVRMVFGRMNWDRPASTIFKDLRYYNLTKEARSIMKETASQSQEKRIAADLDGKRQPASGSRWGYKRDVITPELLIEAKTTEANRISIRFDDLEFLKSQAYMQGLVPTYIVDVGRYESAAVLPENDLDPKILLSSERVHVKPNKKSFSLDEGLLSQLSPKIHLAVQHGENSYVVLCYQTFLDFAKKGL